MNVVLCRSNPVTADPRVTKTAKALMKAGFKVSICCWDRERTTNSRDIINGIHIFRQGIPAKYGSGFHNLIPQLHWQLKLMFWLLKNRSCIDIIHACDFDTVMPSVFMKVFSNKKIVYDIFDFYADNLRNTPQLLKDIIRKIDLIILSHIDHIILADDTRRIQIDKASNRSVSIIYNTPEDKLKLLKEEITTLNDETFRLAYVGQLLTERSLLELFNILQKHTDWELELAGFGSDEELILKNAKTLPNIHWYGLVSYSEALRINFQADVLLAIYNPAIDNHKLASPNKVFEAMMLKKPIIVAKDTTIDRLISANKTGCVVEYGNCQQLENVLIDLANNPKTCVEMGKRARQLYEEKYHWDRMESILLDIYSGLMNKNKK